MLMYINESRLDYVNNFGTIKIYGTPNLHILIIRLNAKQKGGKFTKI